MTEKKCYICKRPKPTKPLLMVGIQGYRRYPVCIECTKALVAKALNKKGGRIT
jgi:hypothetical protein